MAAVLKTIKYCISATV